MDEFANVCAAFVSRVVHTFVHFVLVRRSMRTSDADFVTPFLTKSVSLRTKCSGWQPVAHQPEKQHGFRAGRRLEEHLLTANLFLDKTLAANMPVWILSLDLSKAFDRVDWGALWLALSEHGVSSHMLWIIQNLYFNQHGEVAGQGGNSRAFQINAGVRQGCVLSPKMFSSVLQKRNFLPMFKSASFTLYNG